MRKDLTVHDDSQASSKHVLRWLHRFDFVPQILSPEYMIIRQEVSVSVQAIIVRGEITPKASSEAVRGGVIVARNTTVQGYCREGGRSFTLFRHEFYRLLSSAADPFVQLAVELPCLMGFRCREVATWRAEYIQFNLGYCLVLDAKKKQLFPLPLNAVVAKHAEAVLSGRTEGYVLKSRSTGGRGRHLDKPLSDVAVWKVWRNQAERLNLFPSPTEYSPVVGRRFFAAEWFYGQGLSLATLSRLMRHNDIPTTSRYVEQLIFAEDLKRDYSKFELKVMEEMTKQMENMQYVER
jgi:integrase